MYIHIYIQKSQRSWLRAQATQAGHVRDLNQSAAKPGAFAATKQTCTARSLILLENSGP